MKLYVNVKQAGSRKNFIMKEEIVLDSVPKNLRELIRLVVTKNVKEYDEKLKSERLIDYLTEEEIGKGAKVGKVSFGNVYNSSSQDLQKALEVAYLAYEDGIYRVFIGDDEAGNLNESLEIKDGTVLTFVKLTMLSGRMW